MPLKSINENPLAAAKIASILSQREKKITIIDIGARAGAASCWEPLGDALQVIGFEPEKNECELLNKTSKNKNQKFYPYALHEKSGIRDFYITNSPSSSGFDQINLEFCKRFPTIPLTNSVPSTTQ